MLARVSSQAPRFHDSKPSCTRCSCLLGTYLLRQRVEDQVGARDLERRGLVGPGDVSGLVDQDQRPPALAVLLAVDAVCRGHLPLGVEIRQQGHRQAESLAEGAMTVGRVDTDSDELGALALDLAENLLVDAQLVTADR